MFEKPSSTHTVGISLSESALSVVEMQGSEKGARIKQAFRLPFTSNLSLEEKIALFIRSKEGKKLKNLYETHLLVSSLPTSAVLLRSLRIPLTKEKEIDQALAFQTEPLLPFPVEDAVLDRLIVSQTETDSQLTVIAAPKEPLKEHLERLEAFQIEPEVVCSLPGALACFAGRYVEEKTLFVLHLGTSEACCLLVEEGRPMAAKSLSGKMDSLKELRLEVARTLLALQKQRENVSALLITGEGVLVEGAVETLCEGLAFTIVSPAVPKNSPLSEKELLSYAKPLGCGLFGLPDNKYPVNFRQGELSHPKPWRRYKQSIALYFAACAALAVSLFLFSSASLSQRENAIKQRFAELLVASEKPPERAQELSAEDREWELNALEKEFQVDPKSFPLQPNIPRVSDFLAWLSSHPNVTTEESKALLQIESVYYTMIKRPQKSKPKERYQVKVSLEFTAPTAKLAREFHDALLASSDMINLKEGVKWGVNRDIYKATFILKNKPLSCG